VSIIERAPVVGDQGDNILRIGLFLLLFMQTDEYWSLDARRRSRLDRDRPWLPRWFSNGVHNVALAALAFQAVAVYFWAGLAKARGELWQDGTALYYPLQLPEFRPFPLLNDALTEVGVIVAMATYAAFFIQLAFPFALLNPVARKAIIALVVVFHLAIAVLMALPWFSLSMLAFDTIFLNESTYVAADRWTRRRWRALLGRDLARDAAGGEHEEDHREGERAGGGGEGSEALPGDDEPGQQAAEPAGQVEGQVAEALDQGPHRRVDGAAEQGGARDH
jgi:hypothetical protein